MKEKLIGALIGILMKTLTPELVKDMTDNLLDWVEDKVLGTASTVDDAIVLPVCGMIRSAFDIPDND